MKYSKGPSAKLCKADFEDIQVGLRATHPIVERACGRASTCHPQPGCGWAWSGDTDIARGEEWRTDEIVARGMDELYVCVRSKRAGYLLVEILNQQYDGEDAMVLALLWR